MLIFFFFQIKKLLNKPVVRESCYYRKLTDRGKDEPVPSYNEAHIENLIGEITLVFMVVFNLCFDLSQLSKLLLLPWHWKGHKIICSYHMSEDCQEIVFLYELFISFCQVIEDYYLLQKLVFSQRPVSLVILSSIMEPWSTSAAWCRNWRRVRKQERR